MTEVYTGTAAIVMDEDGSSFRRSHEPPKEP